MENLKKKKNLQALTVSCSSGDIPKHKMHFLAPVIANPLQIHSHLWAGPPNPTLQIDLSHPASSASPSTDHAVNLQWQAEIQQL